MPQTDQRHKRRGGNMKSAPPGYYTAREAQERLGLNSNTFQYYVRTGRIKKVIPPLRSEGYYPKEEIDRLALETALFFHTASAPDPQVVARVARAEDAPGIVEVLTSMDWPAATAEQRLSWYGVNPYIDHVIISHGKVAGYLTAVPYTPDALEDIMSGKRRAWHMTPDDVLPYIPGHAYTLYVGIAVRQEFHNPKMLSARLIASFFQFLGKLALEQGILIRRMEGVSNEKEGIELGDSLGFKRDPARPGDYGNRFSIDMETSDSHFARLYRDAVRQSGALLLAGVESLNDVWREQGISVAAIRVKSENEGTRYRLEQAGFKQVTPDTYELELSPAQPAAP